MRCSSVFMVGCSGATRNSGANSRVMTTAAASTPTMDQMPSCQPTASMIGGRMKPPPAPASETPLWRMARNSPTRRFGVLRVTTVMLAGP